MLKQSLHSGYDIADTSRSLLLQHRAAAKNCQLLEAKDNLQRMLTAIPLTEEERGAVEEGADAVERLLARLADVPTPTGQTPRQLTQQSLPVIQ